MEQVDVPNKLLVDNYEQHNTPTHDTNKGGKGKVQRRQQQKIPKQMLETMGGVWDRVAQGMLEKSGGFCKWAMGTLGTKQNFEYYELKTGQRLKSPPNHM